MKKLIIKSQLLVTLLITLGLGIAAQAQPPPPGTKCYVFVQSLLPCRSDKKVPLNTWIDDNWDGSASNNGRCLMRARDYHSYCTQYPGQQLRVFASFNILFPGVGINQTLNGQFIDDPNHIYTYGYNGIILPTR